MPQCTRSLTSLVSSAANASGIHPSSKVSLNQQLHARAQSQQSPPLLPQLPYTIVTRVPTQQVRSRAQTHQPSSPRSHPPISTSPPNESHHKQRGVTVTTQQLRPRAQTHQPSSSLLLGMQTYNQQLRALRAPPPHQSQQQNVPARSSNVESQQQKRTITRKRRPRVQTHQPSSPSLGAKTKKANFGMMGAIMVRANRRRGGQPKRRGKQQQMPPPSPLSAPPPIESLQKGIATTQQPLSAPLPTESHHQKRIVTTRQVRPRAQTRQPSSPSKKANFGMMGAIMVRANRSRGGPPKRSDKQQQMPPSSPLSASPPTESLQKGIVTNRPLRPRAQTRQLSSPPFGAKTKKGKFVVACRYV